MSNRLTKEIRKDILRRAMRDIFESRIKKLKEQTNMFAKDFYKAYIEEEMQMIEDLKLSLDWVPKKAYNMSFMLPGEKGEIQLWTTEVGYTARTLRQREENQELYCIRQLSGAPYSDPQFCLGKTRKVPTEYDGCIETCAHWTVKLRTLRNRGIALVKEERKLYDELEAFLFSCKTFKQVEDNWAEGKKYLPHIEKPKSLPIPLVDNVSKALKKAS